MKTRFLVSLLVMILLAGTLVHFVPPSRPPSLERPGQKIVRDHLWAQVLQSAKLFRAGDFHRAAALSLEGSRHALLAHEPKLAAYFLVNLGGCRFALHQYRQALQTYLEARRLAEALHDRNTEGKLDLNISWLYSELGQMEAATEVTSRAAARLTGPERVEELPNLLIHLAGLHAGQGHVQQATDLYRKGIDAAARANNLEYYAVGCNNLGHLYLENQQLPQAECALLEAYRVRKLNHMRSVESSYEDLGMLRLAQGDVNSAATLLDRAVTLSKQPGGLRPNWEVYYSRGRVRLEQNRLAAAMEDLRIAARLARNWRRQAPPDDATRVSAENEVQKVYSSLVEAGSRLYFATGRRELVQETFESAESNRASSLRVLLTEPRDWRHNLPAEYWETLQKLEAAEAELLQSKEGSIGPAAEQVRQLQGVLIQWESHAGSGIDVELPDLLGHTRRNIDPDTAFFAFHLSSPSSYLWAVTQQSYALYRLPSGPEISRLVADFTRDLRQGTSTAQPEGARIFRMLFGQIGPAFRRKKQWLLELDAQLFRLPFATLVEENSARGPVFLAERHALRITSGAAMLSAGGRPRGIREGPFLGVADPVYNQADPRWPGKRPAALLNLFAARADDFGSDDGLHLARLAGSAREVAACAAAWGGSRPAVLLEGAAASRKRIMAALGARPAVLHFATHVMDSVQGARSGLIVLSLTAAGRPEVLSPAEIATWNLDGALVSLSGCSSGSAETLPATGLMGVTRACQAAGASAVVASLWSTPDDAGTFFLAYYRHLRETPQTGPAIALEHAQVDMLRSGTWRSDPLYWGAYFVMGNQ